MLLAEHNTTMEPADEVYRENEVGRGLGCDMEGEATGVHPAQARDLRRSLRVEVESEELKKKTGACVGSRIGRVQRELNFVCYVLSTIPSPRSKP